MVLTVTGRLHMCAWLRGIIPSQIALTTDVNKAKLVADELEEIDELEAKVARLEARGIEDMHHELETWQEVKSYWQKVSGQARRSPAANALYRQTPANLAALLDVAIAADL